MAKLNKRLKKSNIDIINAVVIGTGFGRLDELLASFKTVFYISELLPNIRSRNLVYKTDFDDIGQLPNVTVIFFDRDKVLKIPDTVPLMLYSWPSIVIEGNDVIGREYSTDLYKHGYRALEQHGMFHVWKKIK